MRGAPDPDLHANDREQLRARLHRLEFGAARHGCAELHRSDGGQRGPARYGAKTLLNGVVLPAGQNTAKDLNDALDNIFNDPNVGPFVSKQLIQHLVTSNPTPATSRGSPPCSTAAGARAAT